MRLSSKLSHLPYPRDSGEIRSGAWTTFWNRLGVRESNSHNRLTSPPLPQPEPKIRGTREIQEPVSQSRWPSWHRSLSADTRRADAQTGASKFSHATCGGACARKTLASSFFGTACIINTRCGALQSYCPPQAAHHHVHCFFLLLPESLCVCEIHQK